MSEEKLIQIIKDLPQFAEHFLLVKPKEGGTLIPFKLNRAQMFAHQRLETQLRETGMIRALVCKGRQMGFSTLVQARFLRKTCTTKGITTFILTHEGEATKNLFKMTKGFYESVEPGILPSRGSSSAKELSFPTLRSGYSVGTAGNESTGRSQTIQLFHGSEVAFWPNAEEHAKGVLEAVPREPGTEIILESTANGIGNYFYNLWVAAVTGRSPYQAIFLPWFWDDKYTIKGPNYSLDEEEEQLYENHKDEGLTLEHLAWRREKLNSTSDREEALERFKQEYPFTWMEAFRSPVANRFIKANMVEKARKHEVNTESPLVIGVDPAISDNDRLAIIRRKGRKAYKLETYHNLNTMEIVGLVRRMIDAEKPHKVCIDCIGIGAGVVDRLLELGYSQVEGVNVAHSSSDKERFRNKRAELWSELKDWLDNEMGVQIPDSDELQGDLTAPGYKYDSSNRLLIESKDDMKKRGMKSPDCAEALMLTFHVGEYVQSSSYRPIRLPPHASGMLT